MDYKSQVGLNILKKDDHNMFTIIMQDLRIFQMPTTYQIYHYYARSKNISNANNVSNIQLLRPRSDIKDKK